MEKSIMGNDKKASRAVYSDLMKKIKTSQPPSQRANPKEHRSDISLDAFYILTPVRNANPKEHSSRHSAPILNAYLYITESNYFARGIA